MLFSFTLLAISLSTIENIAVVSNYHFNYLIIPTPRGASQKCHSI